MRVLLSTNLGGGSSGWVEIADGATVGDLLSRFGDSQAISHTLVRLNREPAQLTDVLSADDEVSATPRGFRGAYQDDRFASKRIVARLRQLRDACAVPEAGHDDPVLSMLRERRDAIPPEIQKEMHEDLQRALDERPFSIGSSG